MKRYLTLLACALVVALPAQATEYVKETTLTYVGAQGVMPIQSSTQNNVFINFSGNSVWSVNGGSGGSICPENAAVLPADDTIMRAVALAAIAAGATVQVAVDNSLPTVGSYCQVTMLYIKSN